jgi:hypothetical protein
MKVHKSHPQLEKVEVVHRGYIFECPGCGRDFHVRYARVQADGSLRCPDCSNGSMCWCAGCGAAKPSGEMQRNRWNEPGHRCLDCAAAEPQPKTCDRCGEEFTPKRRDARYCSGRCRVAAHRAKP